MRCAGASALSFEAGKHSFSALQSWRLDNVVSVFDSRVREMIITRSPLRITLGGGGTDLPSYYRNHGGFLIAAAIDKYVYITIHETFVDDIIIKYSKMERVPTVEEIQHPLIREAFKLVGVTNPNIEITSM